MPHVDFTNVYVPSRAPVPTKKVDPKCDKCGTKFETVTQKIRHKCE